MLQDTDRLRILCFVLELSQEDLAKGFAGSPASPKELQRAREQVARWWEGHNQPKRLRNALTGYLQKLANERGLSFDIAKLFADNFTTAGFAKACDKTLAQIVPILSAECRREVFEETDRHPPLNHLRALPEATPKSLAEVTGTYLLFRIHSADRVLCREILRIAPTEAGYFMTGTYQQYTQGEQERTIHLSVFALADFIHAYGAHPDRRAEGQTSILHGVAMRAPFRRTILPGLVLGTMDVGSYAVAQRILLHKINRKPNAANFPVRAIAERGRYANYRRFLEIDPDDEKVMLKVDFDRVARTLEREV